MQFFENVVVVATVHHFFSSREHLPLKVGALQFGS